MTMDAVKLKITELRKEYPGCPDGAVKVLDGVNLEVREGSFVSIVGLNGSGKSTLLRIIAGLEPFSRGEVVVNGRPIRGRAKGIGMVSQDVALLPWRTTLKNIEVGLEFMGVPRKERTDRAMRYIRSFGLNGFEHKYPKELSGGMRQKVAIARTLITKPDLVLMDEPFSALDCHTRNKLQSFLLDIWLCRKDTILFVTHDIEEAVYMSDTIVVLSSSPASVLESIIVDIPRPRDKMGVENNLLRRKVRELLKSVQASQV